MPTRHTERMLAAVVAADMVGFSRMMSVDEDSTILAVRALRQETIEPLVDQFGGKVVKTMGDGFLIRFASAVAAVEASVTIQKRLHAMNDGTPENQKIIMRIGIHVGDIVQEGTDIFGNGVNIAARIEPLSTPGGVSISDDVWRQIRDQSDLEWADGGEKSLKNIGRPVQVWHWGGSMEGDISAPVLEVPEKPSVAVLPFSNMSGDPEQEHFADGMTEDLITDLSKISGLFVVARNSTFAFKGQMADAQTVARKLGVRNVIEGSIRKRGEQVRINVQLIEATTGGHLWADRFDGPLSSVFELQDDVCSEVVSALSVRFTRDEKSRATQIHTHNIEAYELFVQAKSTPYPPIPERIMAARQLFTRVAELDPGFAGGWAGQSWVMSMGAMWGHSDPVPLGIKAEKLARKAIAADAEFGWSYMTLALALLVQREFEQALTAATRALTLLPGDSDAHAFSGLIRGLMGDITNGLEAIETAIRLNPHFYNGPYYNIRSHLRFMQADFDGAIASHTENIARGGPVGPPALCWAAACYDQLGRDKERERCCTRLATRFPSFQLSDWNFFNLIKDTSTADHLKSLMIRAGLPA